MPKEAHSWINSDEMHKIDVGQFMISELPKDVRNNVNFGLWSDKGYSDSWRNPYWIVVEERDGERWFGLYSTGRDGVSLTGSNDLDDINSWGQDGFDYYPRVIAQDRRVRYLKKAFFTFLLVGPAVFLMHAGLAKIRKLRNQKANKMQHQKPDRAGGSEA